MICIPVHFQIKCAKGHYIEKQKMSRSFFLYFLFTKRRANGELKWFLDWDPSCSDYLSVYCAFMENGHMSKGSLFESILFGY